MTQINQRTVDDPLKDVYLPFYYVAFSGALILLNLLETDARHLLHSRRPYHHPHCHTNEPLC